MSRMFGTVVRGVRAPIFREGDDVVKGTVETVLNALKEGNVQPRDRDIIAITESVVARTQGNYATIEQIAADAAAKTGGKIVGVTFPILSRNRFSVLLSGIAAGCQKVVLMLSYPSDEVGNHLISMDRLDEKGIDPWRDVLSLERFRAEFGSVIHPFTGVDYVEYYSNIIREAGAEVEVVFSNCVQTILDYTDTVITCDIHTRARSKRLLKAAGARTVLGLDDLMNAPVAGSGYNPQYGHAPRAAAEVPGRQRIRRPFRLRPAGGGGPPHPGKGRRQPGGQHGERGHHSPQPDRSHRFAV